jgi:hypothetical protein
MGRTPKEINWDVVEKKIEAGCSAEEIYECMCAPNTFYNRFKEHFGENFCDYCDKKRRVGPGNIRFTQYMKALAGNTNMLMLLGRELLGQGKEPERVSPFEDSIAIRHENMLLRAELAGYKEHLDADKS